MDDAQNPVKARQNMNWQVWELPERQTSSLLPGPDCSTHLGPKADGSLNNQLTYSLPAARPCPSGRFLVCSELRIGSAARLPSERAHRWALQL